MRGYNLTAQHRSASLCKAMLLVAVLRRAAHRPITADEDELAAAHGHALRPTRQGLRKACKTYGDAALVEGRPGRPG